MKNTTITVSAPTKVHLLGEWSVVWGKPALLAAVDLRITATISPISSSTTSKGPKDGSLNDSPEGFVSKNGLSFLGDEPTSEVRKVVEPIIKKRLHLKKLPPYYLTINSEAPIGTHLGTSAAVSATYIAALLSFFKVKWNLELINRLAYEAEKVFHGNPSGADNSTVVYGGLMWYRKETPDLKIIQPLPFSIPSKLARNLLLINTGTPNQTTKQMIGKITAKFDQNPKLKERFLTSQEELTRNLLSAIKTGDSALMIRIIRAGERNLELIGVCSPEVKKIIRQIEAAGGAAKICGAGAFSGPTGVLLCYHKNPKILEKIAKVSNLGYFKPRLGVEGLIQE